VRRREKDRGGPWTRRVGRRRGTLASAETWGAASAKVVEMEEEEEVGEEEGKKDGVCEKARRQRF